MFSFFDLNPQNVFGAMQLTNVDPIRGDWAIICPVFVALKTIEQLVGCATNRKDPQEESVSNRLLGHLCISNMSLNRFYA